MRKRILAAVIALVMTFGVLPMGVFADAASGECGANGSDVIWTLDNGGTLTISGSGDMKDYSEAKLLPWYSKRSDIKNVVVKNGVTSIGERAFLGCGALENVNMSKSIKSIGRSAFYNCKNLKIINIPSSLTSIGDYAFRDCTGLKSLSIGNGVTIIGRGAFYGCSNLKNLIIGKSVNDIKSYAFYQCVSLEYVKIPNNVTETGLDMFSGCTNLKNAYISENIKILDSFLFNECSSLTSVTIPDSVTHTSYHTFSNCGSLKSVRVGKGMKHVQAYTFYECSGLKDVYYSGTEEEWKKVFIDYYNDPFKNAEVHFNSVMPKTKTFKDANSKVEAVVSEDLIDNNAELVGKIVSPSSVNINGAKINGVLYDICFKKGGQRVLPNGFVEISVPVPDGMNGDSCNVWYIDENGNKMDMNAVCENGRLVFETAYYSYYAIEEGRRYLPGDINNDGNVNSVDKAILNRYLAGWEGYGAMILNWDAADINGDTNVNAADKAILNRYLAGWEGYDKYFEN